jgi:Uma2 family endonuclease
MTVEEYRQLPDEAGKQELLEGALVTLASSSALSERMIRTFSSKLNAILPQDYLAITKAGIQLSESTVVQPDIAIVRRDVFLQHNESLGPWMREAPLLAIDVLSGSIPVSDFLLKIEIYTKLAIPFWMVDETLRITTFHEEMSIATEGVYLPDSLGHVWLSRSALTPSGAAA